MSTPTQLIADAIAAVSKASPRFVDVHHDYGRGVAGALLDLKLLTIDEWRDAIDRLKAAADARQLEAVEVCHA